MRYDNWEIKSRYPESVFKEILEKRKKKNPDFKLNPSYDDLSDPDSVYGVKSAKKKIINTIRNDEKIGIFMDYDADGVCSGAILYRTLTYLGATPLYYVPNRPEGYGLNDKAIDYFKENGVTLIITVDCGIKNFDEVKYARKNGIQTIITDHHLIGDKVPDADIIVHPSYRPSKGSFKYYSGAGVVYQLCRGLMGDVSKVKWLIDLAAISSIADIVPLTGDNRVIVSYGLIVINKTKNIGLRELIRSSGIDSEIGTYEIGYQLAPRLNAAGRISDPKDSFNLLITDDPRQAKEIALRLSALNQKRQNQLDLALKDAMEKIDMKNLSDDNIILVRGKWSEGIVGLISGKITQKYYKPSIVLTEVDGKLKGSARSVKGVDITDLISRYDKLLLSFGGHSQAAGLSLKKSNYNEFKKNIAIESLAIPDDKLKKTLKIDALIKPDDINMEFVRNIEKLKPFGPENSRPRFMLERIQPKSTRPVGKLKKHLKIEIHNSKIQIGCILFDYLTDLCKINSSGKYDLAFSAKIDKWKSREKISLIIEDVKKIDDNMGL